MTRLEEVIREKINSRRSIHELLCREYIKRDSLIEKDLEKYMRALSDHIALLQQVLYEAEEFDG